MKALSIRQPWAWLIVTGRKDVENREWHTRYRGPLLIHAAKTWDEQGYAYIKAFFTDHLPDKYAFGAVIGKADLIACVNSHKSKWFSGPWGFVLQNAKMFPDPFSCPGKPGFFNMDFNAEWQWYFRQLKSEECLCNRPKMSGFAFCRACFKRLPANLQRSLYQKIGEGYEQAFEQSHKYLEENIW